MALRIEKVLSQVLRQERRVLHVRPQLQAVPSNEAHPVQDDLGEPRQNVRHLRSVRGARNIEGRQIDGRC